MPSYMSRWRGVVCSPSGEVIGLELYSNGLAGTMPSQIGLLSSLQRLELYNNPLLQGTIPSELSQTSVHRVVWHTTRLSGTIPSRVSQLSRLSVLSLEYNTLSGTIPSALGQLTAMQYWMVYANIGISGEIPAALSSMSRLVEFLSLNSSLSGSVPQFLQYQTALESIYLSVNHRLSGTTPSFSAARELTALYLNNASVSGTLSQLPEGIWQIDFHGSALSGTAPRSLALLPSLSWCDLQALDLSGSMPSFDSSKLQVLSVQDNVGISGSIPAGLSALTHLAWFMMGHTNMSATLPASLGTLANCLILMTENTKVSGMYVLALS